MKKIFTIILVLLLSCSVVLAANPETTSTGNGLQNQENIQNTADLDDSSETDLDDQEDDKDKTKETINQAKQIKNQVKEQIKGLENQAKEEINQIREETKEKIKTVKAETKEQLKLMIQEKKEEFKKELNENGNKLKQKVFKNQNRVREAVHALLAMEGLSGGIGKNISVIAKEFNNSVEKTIKAEEKIQKRNVLARFFAGGDNEAAEELELELNQNKERIKELKQLREQCDCQDEEIKEMMQEQIQEMEQEHTRLKELAAKEKKSKGLLGWMWK